MRPLRAILPLVRRQPSGALVREAAWRVWKPYRSSRLRAAIRRGDAKVRFRDLPYYQPRLEQIAPESAKAITDFANLICSGRFPFPGYQTIFFGLTPQWNRDFVSGFEWEQLPAAQLQPVVRHNGSDVKAPWELSRLQFLPVLAKAYLLSGEKQYREIAKDLLSDWLAKNPVGMGVNWTLAMESALRGMSLCFTLALLQPLRPEEEDWGRKVTQAIWEHLLYTESCLEFSHLVRSNHYLGNIAGLLCMAMFLDGPGMERRRHLYLSRIQNEILRQVYEDGGDYEASLGYHVLVLQMFTSAYLLMRAANLKPEQQFAERLQQMYRYLAEIAGPSATLPHVGDSDDGRVELLTSDLKQMTSLAPGERNSLFVPGMIGMGDGLFGLEYDGDPSDAAWYGLSPVKKRVSFSQKTIFPQSGIGVVRRDNAEVVFCVIPNGIHGGGSHTHNDKLSVIFRLYGKELFSDSGTFCYTRDTARRNQYRSTASHNTVVIDGEEQNTINLDPHYVFCIGNEASVSAIEVTDNADAIAMCASHSGYERLGVEHRRTVRLSNGALRVQDDLLGEGEHSVDLRWIIPSPWQVTAQDNGRFLLRGPGNASMQITSLLPLKWAETPIQISRTYGGATVKGTLVQASGRGPFPCSLVTETHWSQS
ncbi:MAG TPA: alginate lyase family protein [Pseudacidobacterium sp.]|nr:alginate lyase family protein [Pseudacidobacterium sp.]